MENNKVMNYHDPENVKRLEEENKKLKEFILKNKLFDKKEDDGPNLKESMIIYFMNILLFAQTATLLIALYYNNLSLVRSIIILSIYIPWSTILLGDDIINNLFGKEGYLHYLFFTIVYQYYYAPSTLIGLLFIIPSFLTLVIAVAFYNDPKHFHRGQYYPETPSKYHLFKDGTVSLFTALVITSSVIVVIWMKTYNVFIVGIIVMFGILITSVRSPNLSTTYNNLNQDNSLSMATVLLLYSISSFLILDKDNYLSYMLPLMSSSVILFKFILWIVSHPSDLEGSEEEKTVLRSTVYIGKLIFSIIKTETFSTGIIIFAMYIFINIINKTIITYHIELTNQIYKDINLVYQDFTKYYIKLLDIIDGSLFKTIFFPILSNINAMKLAVKNVFIKGGYPLYVIGNNIDDKIIISNDIFLSIQAFVFIVLNLITLFKFYKPVFNLFHSEFYWLILTISDVVLIVSITTSSRLNNILIMSSNDTNINEGYTNDGLFLMFLLSLLFIFYFRHLIEISIRIRETKNESENQKKDGIIYELKNGLQGFIRQFMRISNFLFLFGIASLIFLSFMNGPINKIKVSNNNERFVDPKIINSISTADNLESKLVSQLPSKLINVIWLAKGVEYATDQIPCINIGVTKVCIGDLLSNAVSALSDNIMKGVSLAVDGIIKGVNSLPSTDLDFLTVTLDRIPVDLPKLDINVDDFFKVPDIQLTIPLWFKILTLIITIFIILLTLVSIRTKVVAYIKLPLYGLTSGIALSLLSIIINLYIIINKNGYKWEIVYADNINLYIASCMLIFLSFCIRYIEVYNENPVFLKLVEKEENISPNDNTTFDIKPEATAPSVDIPDINNNEVKIHLSPPSDTMLGGGLMDQDDKEEVSPGKDEFNSPANSAIALSNQSYIPIDIKPNTEGVEVLLQNRLVEQVKEDFPSFLMLYMMQDRVLNFHGKDVRTSLNYLFNEDKIIKDYMNIVKYKYKEELKHTDDVLKNENIKMSILYDIIWFKVIRRKTDQVIDKYSKTFKDEFKIDLFRFDSSLIETIMNQSFNLLPSINLTIITINPVDSDFDFNTGFQIILWTYLRYSKFNVNILYHNMFTKLYQIKNKQTIFMPLSHDHIFLSETTYNPTDILLDLLIHRQNVKFRVSNHYKMNDVVLSKEDTIKKYTSFFKEARLSQ